MNTPPAYLKLPYLPLAITANSKVVTLKLP